MLLIQSDMWKAFWFLTFPIVTFIYGPIASDSTFCQVNGFFVAQGIEASGMSAPFEMNTITYFDKISLSS